MSARRTLSAALMVVALAAMTAGCTRSGESARQSTAPTNAEWAHYADSLTVRIAALEQYPDAEVRAALQARLPPIVGLMSKGQAAYAAGNLGEALQVLHDVEARIDALCSATVSRPGHRC